MLLTIINKFAGVGDFVVLDAPVSEELCIILGTVLFRTFANTLPFMSS